MSEVGGIRLAASCNRLLGSRLGSVARGKAASSMDLSTE